MMVSPLSLSNACSEDSPDYDFVTIAVRKNLKVDSGRSVGI